MLALQREGRKSSLNSAVIAEKISHAAALCLKMVQEKSIADVLEAYPCLRVEKEVCTDISF
jgi:hypothetical protein